MKYQRLRKANDYYRPKAAPTGGRRFSAASGSRAAVKRGGLGPEVLKLALDCVAILVSVTLLGCVMVSTAGGAEGIRLREPQARPERPGYEAVDGVRFDSLDGLLDFSMFDKAHRLGGEPVTDRDLAGTSYTHAPCAAGRLMRYGIDVSSHSGAINWISVRQSGIEFAMLRAGSRGYSKGDLYEDSDFDVNARSAQRVGMRLGAYVYSQATNIEEITEETELLLRRCRGYKMTMPLVLDFEYADVEGGVGGRLYEAELTTEQATEMCLHFCRLVSAAGYTPMVYANSYMLNNQLDAQRIADAAQIWIAYPSSEQKYLGQQSMWQYSWTGKVPGIDSDVDMNFGYFENE